METVTVLKSFPLWLSCNKRLSLQRKMNIVICGAGVIGASTAYYLALKGVKVTMLEQDYPACAASGKAGGFLALDWCDGQATESLARKSFDLHMRLSSDPKFAECDYRKLKALSLEVKEGRERKRSRKIPSWLDGPFTHSSQIGTTESCAQVLPHKLTASLIKAACDLVGSEVKVARVEKIVVEDGRVAGVKADDTVIPADVVVVAMGPWSSNITRDFNIQPILSRRGHSVVLKPENEISAHALFTSYTSKRGRDHSPELYPRPDGTVYVCGMVDNQPCPDRATHVNPNAESCQKLVEMAGEISSDLKDSDVVHQQACYMPHTRKYLPIIGPIPEVEGAYIACGHNCWGILNAPATGAALAELIVDGKSTIVDLTPFWPGLRS